LIWINKCDFDNAARHLDTQGAPIDGSIHTSVSSHRGQSKETQVSMHDPLPALRGRRTDRRQR